MKEEFPNILCKHCVKKMSDDNSSSPLQTKEIVKDIMLLCPDCSSKEFRAKQWWKDWYQISLKHYNNLGYDQIPCMDNQDILKSVKPITEGCSCGFCDESIMNVKDPFKPDEYGCFIKQYFLCKNCLPKRPDNISPSEWTRLNVGFTARGLEVWCARCNISIINLDFNGQHPTKI